MARQDLVRALVPEDQAASVREELLALRSAGVESVTIAAADPASYRDERPDLVARDLVKRGGSRLILGALIGFVVGAAIALLVPALREWAPYSVLLLAFGGAWGGAVTLTARGVQKDKPEDDLPEQRHEVRPEEADVMRVLTVVVERDRGPVVDLLREREYVLLDSELPRRQRLDQQPADRMAGTIDAGHTDAGAGGGSGAGVPGETRPVHETRPASEPADDESRPASQSRLAADDPATSDPGSVNDPGPRPAGSSDASDRDGRAPSP
jgi:uncharacterized membrane protein